MALPPREYLSLEKAAKRWGIERADVEYSIFHDGLEACCWFDHRKVDYYVMEGATSYSEWFGGYAGIFAHDCRRIFRPGDAYIRSFYILDGGGAYFYIPKGTKAALIHPGEVVMRLSACQEFEKRFDLIPTPDAVLVIENRHELSYNGEPLHFGPVQQQVIHLLCEAERKNNPWMNGKILLDRAGSQAPRLRDLFKGNPVWKELIQSDKRGHYRLHEHLQIEHHELEEEAA